MQQQDFMMEITFTFLGAMSGIIGVFFFAFLIEPKFPKKLHFFGNYSLYIYPEQLQILVVITFLFSILGQSMENPIVKIITLVMVLIGVIIYTKVVVLIQQLLKKYLIKWRI